MNKDDSRKDNKPITYRDAGVDIEAGDALVERIKPFAKKTMRAEVLGGIGGFGSLFEVPKKYKEPVLVSGTDGVGTKLKLAFELNKHDTVGIDLVAMSIVVANMIGTGVFTSLGFQLFDIQSGFGIITIWLVGGLVAYYCSHFCFGQGSVQQKLCELRFWVALEVSGPCLKCLKNIKSLFSSQGQMG